MARRAGEGREVTMPADPIGLPGIAAFFVGALAFILSVFAARGRGGGRESGATRSRASLVGIIVQGIGIGIAGFGVQHVTLDPLSTKALVEAAVVAMLMAGAVGLFVWASRTMGRNWSIVARTRADHQLVQDGPFRLIRHPIYTAMALLMIALAIAFGHTRHLVFAVPVFALGTWLRIRIEERMLRTMFAGDYDAYAARVKRFLPGII